MSSGPPEDTSISTARSLILQRRYADAIALLRSQVEGKKASVRKRLQFADVLILGGRGLEAVPILLSLADELAAEGFLAKAVAVLKRAEKIQPGRSDVQERLAVLVRRPPPPSPPSAGQAPKALPPAADPPPQGPPPEPAPPPAPTPEAAPSPPVAEKAAPTTEVAPATGFFERVRDVLARFTPPQLTGPAVSAVTVPEAARAAMGPVDSEAPIALGPGAPAVEPEAEPASAPPATPEPAQEPVAETPVAETPVAETPVAETPVAETPVAETPAPSEPVAERAVEPAPPRAEPVAPFVLSPSQAVVEAVREAIAQASPPAHHAPSATAVLADRMRRVFRRVLATIPRPSPTRPDEHYAPVVAATLPPAPAAETPPPPSAEPAPIIEAEAAAAPAPAAPAPAAPAPAALAPAALAPAALAPAALAPAALAPAALAPAALALAAPVPAAPVEDAPVEDAPAPASVEAAPAEVSPPSARTPEVPEFPISENDLVGEAEPSLESLAPGHAAMLEIDDATFEAKLLDLIEDMIRPDAEPPAAVEELAAPVEGAPVPLTAEARRLHTIPPFGGLSEEELLAVVRGLQLVTLEPGQVVITEGEEGQSLFIIASGAVRIFVRNPAGSSVEVATLGEGEFFGEVSSLSGQPRTATVVASAPCELLELDKPSLEMIARSHQVVRERLNAVFLERVGSPRAALARAVATPEVAVQMQAGGALEAHFGEGAWSPRMKLRLADVLFKAGRQEDVVPILLGLADELSRSGYPEKAVAVLKKVDRLRRHPPEVAPTTAKPPERSGLIPVDAPPEPPPGGPPPRTAEYFHDWLLEMARRRVARAEAGTAVPADVPVEAARLAGYLGGLRASPLFQSLSEEELLAFVQGLRLHTFHPGQIILTEGEGGQSLFVVAAGKVRVHVKNPAGRNIEVAELGQAAVFGEIAALTDRPRSATVTAAAPCELLEMDRAGLAALDTRHPGVRAILQDLYIERVSSPQTLRIRTFPGKDAGGR
jgi:CRP-like cAMP-binding protein